MTGLSPTQVRALFGEEADERLRSLGQLLLRLEDASSDESVLRAVFRELHSLKGSAAMTGLPEVSDLAHELEEVVGELRDGRRPVTSEVVDVLLAGTDRLAAMINGTAPVREPGARGGTDHPGEGSPERRSGLPAAVADAVLPQATDAQAERSPARTLLREPQPVPGPGQSGARPAVDRDLVAVPSERLESLVRLVGEASSAHLRVGLMLEQELGLDTVASTELNELSRALHRLQDHATRTQMVPVSTITDPVRRAVRDLARAQGKDVRWRELGVETELDRGVLRRLQDPLLHLVRNAVDHGIETPAERVAAGKPPHGTLTLHAMQLGPDVIIAVSDDGRGIDVDRVARRAALVGIDTDGMSEDQLCQLVFRAGLSTTSEVTAVSGRGVGLDVVRSNVEAARGRVEVRSEPGTGTELRIIVPITLAVLRCLLVEAGDQRFALPFHRVVVTQAYDSERELDSEGRRGVWVSGSPVPVSSLGATLDLPTTQCPSGSLVVLVDGSRRHAFHVDRLVGQRDVVIKGISQLLGPVPAVAGASVEPDGSIMLVLDPPGLIERALRTGFRAEPDPTAAERSGPRPRVLVVDDALTIRELQRTVLERAGFDVAVAPDGEQALRQLSADPRDLVLTDVDMPGMDGVALIRAIRGAPALRDVPVLVLTSRTGDRDRQEALEAGADAYLAKADFDEASLLAAVHRLLGRPR
jgi:two-component system chemotaxis sensor kinase CheA